MAEILKISGWLLFSAVKFLIAPGSIYAIGHYSFWETIIISVAGGWIGVFAFYFSGRAIMQFTNWLLHRLKTGPPKQKKRFTKFNRIIIKVKNNFGLIGLALITPSIISIPVGCVLAAKYFYHDKKTIPALMASVIFWAFALTSLVGYFDLRF